VPKYGGGHYWSTDENDNREFKLMQKLNTKIDATSRIKDKIATDITEINEIPIAKEKIKKILESIEFFREEHAEVSAISSCARRGISPLGCKIYCTTLPCHLCIKSIVSSGIEDVCYIEPYAKSKI